MSSKELNRRNFGRSLRARRQLGCASRTAPNCKVAESERCNRYAARLSSIPQWLGTWRLTDPSYHGQILVLTYPLIGNYGVPAMRSEGLGRPYRSDRIQVQALVVQNYVDTHSHHSASRSLHEWLIAERVAGLTGVDTRSLTRRLRERGTMKGWLYPATMTAEKAQEAAVGVDMREEVFRAVAPREPIRYARGELTVLLVDVGAKDNIVRSLLARDASVIRAPWHVDLVALASQADGIVIGNGPGDPKDLVPLIRQIRSLLQSYRKPIFGVCLGNQILALAAGAIRTNSRTATVA